MFDFLCAFLGDLDDPAKAARYDNPPALFEVSADLPGIAQNSTKACTVTLCDAATNSVRRFDYLDKGFCPISAGNTYLKSSGNGSSVRAFAFGGGLPSDFMATLRSGELAFAWSSGHLLARHETKVREGISFLDTILVASGDGTELGRVVITSPAALIDDGFTALRFALGTVVHASIGLDEVKGLLMTKNIAIAVIGSEGYQVPVGAYESTWPPPAMVATKVTEPVLAGSELRQLAQVACALLPGNPDTLSRVLVDLYRIDPTLGRLNDNCE